MRHVAWIVIGTVLSGLAVVMGVRRRRARLVERRKPKGVAVETWENEGGAPAPRHDLTYH
jgi:hypothetical protein